jgi:predicted polyphosphate/ATP-dependent NAD kinase
MNAKTKIGLIVNPVAGMGGNVGLKRTDGRMRQRAVEIGARPITPKRARQFLTRIRNTDRIELLVAPGRMGEQYAFRSL